MMHKYSNYANKNEETSYITRTFDIKHAKYNNSKSYFYILKIIKLSKYNIM